MSTTMKTRDEALPRFLRECREKAGLTQKEVADHLNYSTAQFISSWERGEREPPINIIHKIAELFRVEPDAIFEMALKSRMEQIEFEMRGEYKNEGPRNRRS